LQSIFSGIFKASQWRLDFEGLGTASVVLGICMLLFDGTKNPKYLFLIFAGGITSNGLLPEKVSLLFSSR
jgi:hypothetical protein